MLRSAMLHLAQNERVHRFVSKNGISKGFALRFVAGETAEEAIQAVRDLNAGGLTATLDALGENVTSQAESKAAADEYCEMLDRIAESGVRSTISVKLTMLGLDISREVCLENLRPILERARSHDNFVRIDMEGSAYTKQTLSIFYEVHPEFGHHVGIVLQSYLYRTDRDVEHAIQQGARVRLVKGAYAEPVTVAYPRKEAVDDAFRRQMIALLDRGNYPAIATHDEALIAVACEHVARNGIDSSRYEFQLLYGVRRDLQQQLAREGHTVRVYVPYGSQWYPYFMRRMAERPANLLFVLRNLARP